MKFTYQGKEYRIKFRHQLPTTRVVKPWFYLQGLKGLIMQVPGWTLCIIQRFDETWVDTPQNAYAYQSKKDSWSKEMGRRVSLGKTLKRCNLEFVKAAEGAYYGRRKGKVAGVESSR